MVLATFFTCLAEIHREAALFFVKSMVCVHGRLSSPWTQWHLRLDREQLACMKADLARSFKNILWFSTGLFAGLARLCSELLVPITCPSHPPSFVVMLLFP